MHRKFTGKHSEYQHERKDEGLKEVGLDGGRRSALQRTLNQVTPRTVCYDGRKGRM